MTQCLRTPITHSSTVSVFSSRSPIGYYTSSCNSSYGESDVFWLPYTPVHTHTQRQTYTYTTESKNTKDVKKYNYFFTHIFLSQARSEEKHTSPYLLTQNGYDELSGPWFNNSYESSMYLSLRTCRNVNTSSFKELLRFYRHMDISMYAYC